METITIKSKPEGNPSFCRRWLLINVRAAVVLFAAGLRLLAAPGDWPLFNYDERNSCNTPLTGRITSPAFKWRTYPDAQPQIWTGFTFSRDQGLTFLPIIECELIRLDPLTGATVDLKVPPGPFNAGGTGESIPLHADLDGDGSNELIVPYDGYGIVVYRTDGSIFWQRPVRSEIGTIRSDLNITVGDVNGDGQKEVMLHDDGRTFRILRCLSGLTGEELWVFNKNLVGNYIEGATTQNFEVWFDVENDGIPELLIQEQADLRQPDGNSSHGVLIRCIRTVPTQKTLSWLNNWPSPYSTKPLDFAPTVSPGGDPSIGTYEIVFVGPNTVTVNGGSPIEIIKGQDPNTQVIDGCTLYFHPDSNVGDHAEVTVHHYVEQVWGLALSTGYCFAHFLLADFDNDGEDEIAFGTTARYYCIEKNGAIRWSYDTGLPANPFEDLSYGGAFADIDGDGIKEIVFNAWDELVCLNGMTGEKKWSYFAPDGHRTTFYDSNSNFYRVYPLIADVDGDGQPEIVTADYTQVYAFNPQGQVKWTLPFAIRMPDTRIFTIDGDWIEYPHRSKRWIFADIDGDGFGEIVGSYMKVRGFSDSPARPHVVFAIGDRSEVEQAWPIAAGTVSLVGNVVRFTAQPGLANDVTIELRGGILQIQDASGRLSANTSEGFFQASPNKVTIVAANITQIEAFLSDQNDRIQLTPSVTIPAKLLGEDGDDIMIGGAGDDEFVNEPGYDTINGGQGYDRLVATADADMSATDSLLSIGATETDTFSGIEELDLIGGPSDNVLDASAVSAASGLVQKQAH